MDVTANIYSPGKNLAYSIFGKACALYDADVNDSRQILYGLIQDLGYILGLVGFKVTGFQVIPSSPLENNFALIAGYGMYLGKHMYLAENAPLLPITDTQSNMNLNFVVSALTATTLTDYRRNMVINAYAGQKVFVHRTGHIPRQYTIVSNTSTTFTFSGTDLVSDGVTRGDYYTIQPSTPGAARNDAVLVNLFLDEVTAEEDPDLSHNIGGAFENESRQKIRTCIEVIEGIGSTSSYTVPSDYVDLLGNSHTYILIAFLERAGGVATIQMTDIVDARTELHEVTDYVLKSGDTMEGDLNFDYFRSYGYNGNIDFATGYIDGFLNVKTSYLYLTNMVTEVDQVRMLSGVATSPTEFYMTVQQYAPTGFGGVYEWSTARVKVDTPIDSDDAVTKEYTDTLVSTHTHQQYLEREALENAMNRIDGDAIVTLLGNSVFTVGATTYNFVDWNHGLGAEFLQMQVLFRPASGVDMGLWIDGSSLITLVQVDSNTLRIRNDTSSDIPAIDVRVSVMTTQISQILSITESYSASKYSSVAEEV
jgi:hypothetical protein